MGSRFLKKADPSHAERTDLEVAEDAVFSDAYPALWEYLTLETWDDGTSRQTATLLVLSEGGSIKGCLNDRERERSCWATSWSFDGLLKALDEKLADGSAEWRSSGAWKGKSGGKRK